MDLRNVTLAGLTILCGLFSTENQLKQRALVGLYKRSHCWKFENCLLFQLISGDGSGSTDIADSSAIVQEACDYYTVNQDFTLEHQNALKKLYPHLQTFKELTALCKDDVRSHSSLKYPPY